MNNLEALINKHNQKQNNNTHIIKVNDLTYTVNKIALSKVIELQDEYGDSKSGQFEFAKELTYLSIQDFRDPKLHAMVDVTGDPHNIIEEIFEPKELTLLLTEVSKCYGEQVDVKKQ